MGADDYKGLKIKKESREALDKIRIDYTEQIQRISNDIEMYHDIAFSKFLFNFHATWSNLLKCTDNFTVDELLEQTQNISSKIYKLNKKIEKKENKLIAESDKKKFQVIKKKIEKIKLEKNYYAVIERNIAVNNLIFTLDNINKDINKMGYSGLKYSGTEVRTVIQSSVNVINQITKTNKEIKSGFLTDTIHKITDKLSKKEIQAKTDFIDNPNSTTNQQTTTNQNQTTNVENNNNNIMNQINSLKTEVESNPIINEHIQTTTETTNQATQKPIIDNKQTDNPQNTQPEVRPTVTPIIEAQKEESKKPEPDMNDEVIKYIVDARKAGLEIDNIRINLLNNGFTEAMIREKITKSGINN